MVSILSKIVIGFCTILLFCESSHGQDQIKMAGTGLWSGRNDMCLHGDYIYCAMTNGIAIIDIKDPANPREVKLIYLGIDALRIEISNDFLYLGTTEGTLLIFNIDRSLEPVKIGEIDSDYGKITDIEVVDNLAFIIHYTGLQIVDIANPQNPEFVGFILVPVYRTRGVFIDNDIAYIASGDLWIVDISDPSSPFEINHFPLDEDYNTLAWDVIVVDSLAYVVGQASIQPYWASSFSIINISDPLNPELYSYDTLYCNTYSVALDDTLAFIAAGEAGVVVFDISDPRETNLLSCVFGTGMTEQIIVDDDLVYVRNTSPVSVETAGGYDHCDEVYRYYMYPSGDFIVLDNSTPDNLSEIGRILNPHVLRNVFVNDTLIVCTNDEMGSVMFATLDRRLGMSVKSTIYIGDQVVNPYVVGQYAYLPSFYRGLIIIDLADIENPEIVGICDSPDYSEDVKVVGDYAYLADWHGGLYVISVSDVTNPQLVGALDLPGYCSEIEISGNYAYILNGSDGIAIIDISYPSSPEEVARYPSSFDGIVRYHIEIHDTVLYASSYDLELIGISSPNNPILLNTLSFGEYCRGMALSNQSLFMVIDHSLKIVDVCDPSEPTISATGSTTDWLQGVSANNRYFFAANSRGLFAYDQINTNCNTSGNQGIVLYPNYPNPFSSLTIIEFSIPERSHVKLEVYNILGQLVHTLVDGTMDGGKHSLEWDITKEKRNLASGVYTLRLTSNNSTLARSMILLK